MRLALMAVISALGVTRQKAWTPWDIDYRANLNILESARAHDVTRFCYVNAIHAESIRSTAHACENGFRTGIDPVAAGASGGEPEWILLGYERYSADGTPRPGVSSATARAA